MGLYKVSGWVRRIRIRSITSVFPLDISSDLGPRLLQFWIFKPIPSIPCIWDEPPTTFFVNFPSIEQLQLFLKISKYIAVSTIGKVATESPIFKKHYSNQGSDLPQCSRRKLQMFLLDRINSKII